jgi:metal-dependent amidase/aminoacylase/carboxypeptidase family protein
VPNDLGLTLTVIGTPAEEGGGGKIELLERDGFQCGCATRQTVVPGPHRRARGGPSRRHAVRCTQNPTMGEEFRRGWCGHDRECR